MRPAILSLLAIVVLGPLLAAPASGAEPSPASVPPLVVQHGPFEVEVESGHYDAVPFSLMIIDGDGEAVFTHNGVIPATVHNIRIPSSGPHTLMLVTAGQTWESTFRSLAGWQTLLPALLAIAMALVFRQVYVALTAGIWLGAMIVKDFDPVGGFFYIVDHYVIDAIAGSSGWDHASIAVFTALLGGMVGVISANGGARGVVNAVSRFATSATRGQVATWMMGLAIFFDDYTNTLIVGNTMRPVTDRLRISREKLAYIVDSTAAPVACVAVITSWIGFEISLLKDAFESVGMLDRNPFTTFVASIRYSYYPILTLLFVFLVAVWGRDFGPMLRAERRARRTGELLAPGATPISNIDSEIGETGSVPERWFNAVLPVIVVVAGTVWALVETGRTSLISQGELHPSLFDALRAGNSFDALLWSSFLGCTVAILMTVVQRILPLGKAVGAWVGGVKAMTPAIIILILAWGIGAVCKDLHTADYLVGRLSGVIAPELLPGLIFLVAGAVSFSTGTSWGTMTILTPLCIPLVIQVTHLSDMSAAVADATLLSGIAAVLSGAVFGDHCSPISDTTIMSSMASTSDHIDHVRTQLPYAMTVALVAVLLGYTPVALGVPLWVAMLVSVGAVVAVIRLIGRPVEVEPKRL